MATEPAPAEINLREPRKRGRDFSALLWLCGWGVATAVALSALAITSQTQTATDRLRSIFAVSEPSAVAQMPPRVAQLELETQMLTEQVRALNADRDRLAGRIALLESSVDDMTGAIKRQAAATAAALAARTVSPASQPQPSHDAACRHGPCCRSWCARGQNRSRHHRVCPFAARTRRSAAQASVGPETGGQHERVRPRSRRRFDARWRAATLDDREGQFWPAPEQPAPAGSTRAPPGQNGLPARGRPAAQQPGRHRALRPLQCRAHALPRRQV